MYIHKFVDAKITVYYNLLSARKKHIVLCIILAEDSKFDAIERKI